MEAPKCSLVWIYFSADTPPPLAVLPPFLNNIKIINFDGFKNTFCLSGEFFDIDESIVFIQPPRIGLVLKIVCL